WAYTFVEATTAMRPPSAPEASPPAQPARMRADAASAAMPKGGCFTSSLYSLMRIILNTDGALRLGRAVQEEGWLLEDGCHVGDEPAHAVAVDDPVVERPGHRRHPARAHLAVDDPRLLADRAERDDAGLAGVDDRGPGIHPEDADVGDGDRAALLLGRRGASFARGQGQPLERLGELAHAELLRVLDVRHQQSSGRGRRDAEVDVVAHPDLGAVVPVDPRRVDHRRAAHRPD